MSKNAKIRPAAESDLPEILDIYKYYVEHTTVSFETSVPETAAFTQRFADIAAVYPYLVCEVSGSVAGFAYASRFGERAAYDYSVGLSVYLKSDFFGNGIAARLYDSLFEILAYQGFYSAFVRISLPNPQSERFHEKYGFAEQGRLKKAGYKLGEWLDISCRRKDILTGGKPAQITPMPQIPQTALNKILEKYTFSV